MHTLNHNFREIYHFLNVPLKGSSSLVANYLGSRIYDSRYSLGIAWRNFYKLSERFKMSFKLQETLKKAVHYTNALFHQEISKIRQPFSQYQDYLKKKGDGYTIDETEFFQARKLITEWNSSTKSFLKAFNHPQIQQCFFQSTGIDPTLLFFSTYSNDLRACQKSIDLEGITKGPLPVQVFKKILKKIPINTIDQKDLEKWIAVVEKNHVEPKSIHKALKYLSTIFAKKNENQKNIDDSLIHLELFLEDKGCNAFKKNDPKHLKWRQSLEKGKAILVNNSPIILGNELYSKSFGSDQTRAYAIDNDPSKIALIAHNPIALSLRQARMQLTKQPDVESIPFSSISSDGRIAIVERLKPLNAIDWVCPNGHLNPEERLIVTTLAGYIQNLIAKNYTPLHFSSSSLMLNKNCQLKFVKPMSKGDFNFTAIEDFISDCASGNPLVFKEIMVQSGLSKHAITKYYQDIVRNALKGDTITPDDLAGIYRISDPKVVDRAILIIELVKEKKKQYLLQLRRSSPNTELAKLDALANQNLYNSYLQSHFASKFYPADLRL